MSVVVPGGTIRICHNVPLDNTYKNTILFESTTEQFSYFVSKAKHTLDNYTYMRVNESLRVEIPAESLYDCNYLVFRNNTFGTKYFYAFITDVTYINNETSEIKYEIDVMQTWHFEYELEQCYVERQHSVTDEIGDNTLDEPVEIGEYLYNANFAQQVPRVDELYYVVFATSAAPEGNPYTPTKRGNNVSCLGFDSFLPTDSQGIYNFINSYQQKARVDDIVCCFLAPKSYIDGDSQGTIEYPFDLDKKVEKIDGYTPKNKKLFTYPYNFIRAISATGDAIDYHYELFSSIKCGFDSAFEYISCDPCIVIWPKQYKSNDKCFAERLTLKGFPQVPYSTDTFKIWLAQNASSLPIYNLTNALGGIPGIMKAIVDTAAKIGISSRTATHPVRGASGVSVSFALGENNIKFYPMCIRAENARLIDDYFTMYGYSCNRKTVPNRSSRPHWNYVKTRECIISGSLPGVTANKICSIYNAGIRWWHHAEEIGDFTFDNSPA